MIFISRDIWSCFVVIWYQNTCMYFKHNLFMLFESYDWFDNKFLLLNPSFELVNTQMGQNCTLFGLKMEIFLKLKLTLWALLPKYQKSDIKLSFILFRVVLILFSLAQFSMQQRQSILWSKSLKSAKIVAFSFIFRQISTPIYIPLVNVTWFLVKTWTCHFTQRTSILA